MTASGGPPAGWATTPDPIAGFRRWSAGDRVLVVADAFEDAVRNLGLLDPGGFARALDAERGPAGRGDTSILTLPDGRRLHLRPIRHGGWLRSVRGRALLGLRRPLDELRLTASLADAGAPVPKPALVMADRAGPFWNATVGTVFEPDAIDIGALLASRPDRDQVRAAAVAAGRAVRAFHDRGGSHRDLHIGNLLVRGPGDARRAVVVDLDRARTIGQVSASARMRELMRLHRSLVKRRFVERVGPRGYAQFWGAYTQRDRALRGALLAHLPRERARVALHTALYR